MAAMEMSPRCPQEGTFCSDVVHTQPPASSSFRTCLSCTAACLRAPGPQSSTHPVTEGDRHIKAPLRPHVGHAKALGTEGNAATLATEALLGWHHSSACFLCLVLLPPLPSTSIDTYEHLAPHTLSLALPPENVTHDS